MEMLTSKKHPAAWACEVIRLLRVANIINVVQCQVQNNDLNEAGECRCHNLSHEHCAGRDLHVVAEFQIRDECQCLGPRRLS